MAIEKHKAVISRLFTEVFGAGNMDALDDILAAEVVWHDATAQETKRGSENVRQVAILFRTAFPDARFPLYDLIAEGDKVVARWGLRGTHRAEFLGIPGTGRSVEVSGMVIYRLAGGKVVEYWGNCDTLGLMQQLGMLSH